MFDKTVALFTGGGGETHHHHTTIERAPTDESVKLLREMEQAAKAEVEKSLNIEDNAFNCLVHVGTDLMSGQVVFKTTFDLNGKRMNVEDRFDMHRDLTALDAQRHVAKKILESIGKKIAEEAIGHLADAFIKANLFRR